MVIGPNVAFVLTVFGLLAIYWELIRPGRIYPGTLGAAAVLAGAYFLWRLGPTADGLKLLAAAGIFFVVEACWNTGFVAGISATAALSLGFWKLFAGPRHIAGYLALPLCLAFGAATIWLSAGAKRARRNKRADL
jgi:membrane-bound serine protease (ClpP class)